MLGGVFCVAGIPKIMDTAGFADAIYNYQILPDALINIVAMVLPWVEIMVGAMLIFGLWLPGAVLMYNGLMAVFLGAIIYAAARGLNIQCGCFSTDAADAIDVKTIIRDSALFIGSLYLLFVVFVKKITTDRMMDGNRETARPRSNQNT